MKTSILLFLSLGLSILTAISAQAETPEQANQMDFYCWSSSTLHCKESILVELQKHKCDIVVKEDNLYDSDYFNSIDCYKTKKEEVQLCQVKSQLCSNAVSDGFRGVKCYDGNKEELIDPKLTATWYLPFWGIKDYVESICVN